jgi:hypothetical protein
MSDKFPGGMITANAPAGFSVAFDGSGDILTTPSSANLAMGTGAFTVECWFYTNGNGSDGLVSAVDSASGNYAPAIYFSGSTTLKASIQNNAAAAFDSGNITFTTNKWNHIALVRDGSGNCAAFLNGVRQVTGTTSQNIAQNVFNIGRTYVNTGSGTFSGYISNARIVKGTAVYDPTQATLNVPTQLFPVTNTQLLTCQSPTIIDNSTNNFAITVSGNAAVSNFTPFAAYQGFNPALGAAAGGVWTIDEAAYYQQNRLWPIYDPYFNQTTLMLHGNGTNAAQNNTFLDSSTNNFTITRNGNTTQGSFSPFSQTGWSNYFGTGYLTVPTNTAFDFGSGDATIEFWAYPTAASQSTGFFDKRSGAGNYSQFPQIAIQSGVLRLFVSYTGSSWAIDITGPTLSINVWTHIAFVRYGNTWTLYVNGVATNSATASGSVYAASDSLSIGASTSGGTNPYTGYISNARVVKGTAVYTANFTPSIQPLNATTGTVLLTCQDNRFVDDSANNFTVTPNSTSSVQAFSPFVPAYITPTTYSNFFDGSTGYLSFPSSANFTFGTGDYTVEAWVNLNTSSTYQTMFGSSTTDALMFNIYSMNSVVIQTAGSNIFATFSGATFATNTWYHVAVSRSSGTVKAFVNGVQYGSTITSNTTNYALPTTNTIGSNAASQYFGGCLSSLRIVKGGALYTANFTPPTAPLTTTVSAGTVSLLTCQNSTFIDNSASANTLTATGSVKPVTSPTPFPANVDTTTLNSAYSTSLIGGSGYFDGTGDYLSVSSATALQLSTGTPFTIEAWVYPTSIPSDNGILGKRPGSGGGGTEWQFFFKSDKTLHLYNGTNDYGSGTAISGVNQWVHAAVSWDLTTLRFFLNGVLCSSTYTGIALGTAGSSVVTVGGDYPNGELWNGYLNGVRLVNGTALYTKAFSPPTTPFTAVANTALLCNFTNGAIFDNTAKNVLETVGNAQISTTQSKWGGSSMYFDGTGDYLLLQAGPNLALGAGDFTIEMWFYVTTTAAVQALIDFRPASTDGVYPLIYISSGGTSIILDVSAGTRITGTTTISTNTWYHFALSRSGTSTKMFVNGTQVGSTYTDSNSYLVGTNRPVIAANGFTLGNNPLTGYIDDLRITKGVARYLTNFTPPTSQLQDQ